MNESIKITTEFTGIVINPYESFSISRKLDDEFIIFRICNKDHGYIWLGPVKNEYIQSTVKLILPVYPNLILDTWKYAYANIDVNINTTTYFCYSIRDNIIVVKPDEGETIKIDCIGAIIRDPKIEVTIGRKT